MSTDPISDLMVGIKNGLQADKESCSVPYSRIKEKILEILKKTNYIKDFEKNKHGKHEVLNVILNKELDSINFTRISKFGRRVYKKSKEIKKVLQGYGVSIISTPQGIMTGDEARKKHLGGEVICEVY